MDSVDELARALKNLIAELTMPIDQGRPVARYVLIGLFAEITGYSEKAVRRKIEDGHWLEGKEYRRAPDGRIHIDLEAYYRWVEQG